MDQLPFTEEPLVASKSISLGKRAEQWFSSQNRHESIPFLISNLISKRCGLKQVDYAELHLGNLILWEVKACWYNEELAFERAVKYQEITKWRKTSCLLSELIKIKVEVRVAVIRYQSGFNFVKNHKLV